MIKRISSNNLNRKDNTILKNVKNFDKTKLQNLRSALIEGEESGDIENFCMNKIKTSNFSYKGNTNK